MAELARRAASRPATVIKAISWLKEQGAPIVYDPSSRVRRLEDIEFTLPLLDPDAEDIAALVVAAALVAPLVDTQTNRRLGRILEELDDLRQEQAGQGVPRPAWISTGVTLATRVDPELMRRLLGSVRRQVLRIRYYNPWKNEHTEQVIDPRHLRLQDGAVYVSGTSRTRAEPRTFNAAFIEHASVVPNATPRPRPPADPSVEPDGFGVDDHFPDEAVLRVRGPVARWVHRVRWHDSQQDRWIEPNQLLERRIRYRSRREFARRILTVIDGIESIEPEELRDEVEGYLRAYRARPE